MTNQGRKPFENGRREAPRTPDAELTFYRQKRYDGAVRTGLELDDETIAESYEGGSDDRDPTLLWFVDLRCFDDDGLPGDPDAADRWLLDHSASIREGFARFAERLRAGADPDIYSLRWSDFAGLPPGVGMQVVCSAARRVDAREMAGDPADVGLRWEDRV